MSEFYRIDDEAAAVRALQKRLRVISTVDERVPAVFIDGIYGDETVAAVTGFQKAHALEPNGEVDLVTHNAINAEYNAILRSRESFVGSPDFENMDGGKISFGDAFDGVSSLQILLRSLGAYDDRFKVELTGIYNEETSVAVRFFQELRGLEQTNEVDRSLWNELALYSERTAENKF